MRLAHHGSRRRRLPQLWLAALAASAAGALALPQVLPAAADPLTPAPTVGTATGSYRTGLATAGLVHVTDLTSAQLWVGLKDAQDRGANVDVQTELLDNGTTIATGLVQCVSGLDVGAAKATKVTVPWGELAANTVRPGDVLALRVSGRPGTAPGGGSCGAPRGRTSAAATGLRLYYASTATPTHFGISITPSPSVDLYLQPDGSSVSLAETSPTSADPSARTAGFGAADSNGWSTVGRWDLAAQCACANDFIPEVRNNPPAPAPEPVSVSELPLPPTAPSTAVGACDATANPHFTGCLDASDQGIAEGPAYLWDGSGVVLPVKFAGAPSSGPGSTYTGNQVIVVKTDGTTFSNGDAWKCLTCGVAGLTPSTAVDHPQAFHDGKRVLLGTNILDCSPYLLTDDACTPDVAHVYPLYWQTKADGTSGTGSMRELRLNPDDAHLGWNKIAFTRQGITEWAYLGRLDFDAAESRYDLTNVYVMVHPDPNKVAQMFSVDPAHPGQLNLDPPAYIIGEFRGFTSDGRSAIGGGSQESYNFDAWATNLQTGASSRLTRNPAYTDPITMSPDDNWSVAMDGRVDHRLTFLGGMPGLPPLKDSATAAAIAAFYNNGNRRFFEPYLIDRYGDRGSYQGQQLNACGPNDDPTPGSGSICDPLWNGRANPAWSPDGTNVVFWQALVTSPACGPSNPSVPSCPTSTEPGGRRTRLMIADLTSRTPVSIPQPAPISDTIPWGVAYHPGDPDPSLQVIPAGTYTLTGNVFGSATVTVAVDSVHNVDSSISVAYTDYSDDGINVINGTESGAQRLPASPFGTTTFTFHENLTLSGCHTGSEVTSEPSGWVVNSSLITGSSWSGTLTTTIDGSTYSSPVNHT